MAQDTKGGRKQLPPRERDATLSFGVQDPKLEGICFISPPLKLYSLKEHLSRFSLLSSSDKAGFNFENFVRNIKGMKYVSLGGMEFEVLFTRTSAFFTFHGLPGMLKDLEPVLGAGPLSRVSILLAKDGAIITVCRLTGRELGTLLGAASASAVSGLVPQSLLPSESGANPDPAQFRERLGQCTVISSVADFNLESFAERISTISVFRDELETAYLVMGMNGEDTVYSLYVNISVPPANEENRMIARLKFNNDTCMLFRADLLC